MNDILKRFRLQQHADDILSFSGARPNPSVGQTTEGSYDAGLCGLQEGKEALRASSTHRRRYVLPLCHHHNITDCSSGNVAAAPSLKRKRGPDAQAGDHDKDVADSQDVVAVVSAGALTGPVDVEAEAPLPPAKRRRRAGRQTTTKASGVALKMPTPLRPVLAPVTQQEQPRGSIAKRKRKLAEVIKESPLDAPQPPKDAAAAAGDSGVSTVEGSAPPRKRTRRATLLAGAEANATAAADAVADKNPVKNHPTVEPPVVAAEPGGGVTIAAPGQLALPPFPADSLEGSIHLARHQVMSRELGRRIDDCRVKWTAAIEALESARHLMDSWLELWKKGQ